MVFTHNIAFQFICHCHALALAQMLNQGLNHEYLDNEPGPVDIAQHFSHVGAIALPYLFQVS